MKIRVKLFLAVTGMVGLVLGSSLIANVEHGRAHAARSVELSAKEAIATAYRLEAVGREAQTRAGLFSETIDAWQKTVADCDNSITSFIAAARQQQPGENTLASLTTLEERWRSVRESYADLGSLYDQLVASGGHIMVNAVGLVRAQLQLGSDSTRNFEQIRLISSLLERFQTATIFTGTITEQLTLIGAETAKTAELSIQRASTISLISLGLAVSMALLLSLLFSRSLGKRIAALEAVMSSVAAKDLTARAGDTGRDELGQLGRHVNSVLDIILRFMERARAAALELAGLEGSLIKTAREADNSSRNIVAAADTIASSAGNLDTSINQTLQAARQVAAALRSFGDLAKDQAEEVAISSGAVQNMSLASSKSAALASARLEAAAELSAAVAGGAEEATQAADSLSGVERELSGIKEISVVIADIADRTNILSMNAAIESAHAGEAGKGFAVVAEEIRKLSESASENASSIDRLVNRVADTVHKAIDSSRRSQNRLGQTRGIVDGFVDALNDIVQASGELESSVVRVQQAMEHIMQSAKSIGQGAAQASRGSAEIEAGMEAIGETSHDVVLQTGSIRDGLQQLSAAVQGFSGLAASSGQRSAELEALLCEFSLDATCE